MDGKVLANQFVPFFAYTPSDIAKHYSEVDYMQAYVRLMRSGKKHFLELRLDFNSLKAIQYYGIIEETSPMNLIFLEQDFISL